MNTDVQLDACVQGRGAGGFFHNGRTCPSGIRSYRGEIRYFARHGRKLTFCIAVDIS